MHVSNRRWALLLGVVLATTSIVACGSDDGDDDSSAPVVTAESADSAETADSTDTADTDPPTSEADAGESADSTADTTADTTAGTTEASEDASSGAAADFPPIEDYDLDGVLRFMWAAPPTSFDPHKAGASFDLTTLQPVYDRLIHLDRDAAPAPGLATEWEFADDGSYLDLTLREGVVFHDGATFDAEAVKANIERAQTVEGSSVAGDLAVIETVEVLSPTMVRLNLSAEAAQLPAVLTDRAGMMVSPDAFDNPDLDVMPVGAGMYQVTEYQPGTQITFERFEDYWEPGAARAAGLEWGISADPTTRFNALRSGQLDGTWLGAAQNSEAKADGLNVVERAGTGLFHLQLNRSNEAFADADVRRAINHAIDRQALVDSVVFGLADPSAQTFPEGYFAFDPETGTDPFPYDPDLARQLLADAGYPDGFEFEMLFQASPSSEVIATALQGQLAEVGVTANLRGIEPVQAAQIFYVDQESDSLAAQWGGRPDPTQTLQLLYSGEGFSNPGRHSTEAMEAAIEETTLVQPEDARAAATQAASAQVVEDALDVVLFFPIQSYGFSEEVLGPDAWGLGFPDFRYVGLAQQ